MVRRTLSAIRASSALSSGRRIVQHPRNSNLNKVYKTPRTGATWTS
jgi:hypothetical protein